MIYPIRKKNSVVMFCLGLTAWLNRIYIELCKTISISKETTMSWTLLLGTTLFMLGCATLAFVYTLKQQKK